jgi:hypothetical protein
MKSDGNSFLDLAAILDIFGLENLQKNAGKFLSTCAYNNFFFYFFGILFDVDGKKRNKDEILGKQFIYKYFPIISDNGCPQAKQEAIRVLLYSPLLLC